jgi:hypothetical protein
MAASCCFSKLKVAPPPRNSAWPRFANRIALLPRPRSDKPGTTHESVGSARSGYEQTDFHQQDEDRFAADAADMLKREVLAGRIGALIVVAAPSTLGELRKHYHAAVERHPAGRDRQGRRGSTER